MSDRITKEPSREASLTQSSSNAAGTERKPSPSERAWEEKTLRPTLEKSPERSREFTTISGRPIRRLYTQADLADLGRRARPRLSRPASLHARNSFHDVSRAPVDHAPVRRLRDRRGHQPALPLFALTGTNGPFRGIRSAYADGIRLRPSAVGRRSGQMRRGHQFARGYGSALRQNSAGGRHHLDDHQFARRAPSGRCTWP